MEVEDCNKDPCVRLFFAGCFLLLPLEKEKPDTHAIKDPERYEECFPEPPVEEVQLAMEEKLKLNSGDPEGGAHPHNHPNWEYVYDYEKTPAMLGKKY